MGILQRLNREANLTIILVVVLAGLTAFVASMVSGQSADQQLERMSRVGDLAARAGLEWGGYQVLRVPVCSASTTLPALPGTLTAVAVTVACSSYATTEGGPVTVYQITATATYGGTNTSPDYVERTKTAVFSR